MAFESTTGSEIAWHRRMETRVALGVSLLVALSLGAIVVAMTQAVTKQSLGRAKEDFEVARATFYQSLGARTDSVTALTRLVTSLPVFRAHLTDTRLRSDTATIDAMADDYRRQLGAEFSIISDPDGHWLASPGWPLPDTRVPSVQASVGLAAHGQSHRDIVSVHGQLFLIISEPARFAEEVLGAMTVGYVLDDKVARELAETTHCEVTLVAGQQISASSLPADERGELASRVSTGAAIWADDSASRIQRLGKEQYVGGTFSLSSDGVSSTDNRLVLLKNWRSSQQFIDQLVRRLFGAAAIIFLFAIVGGVLFSQRLSRPLREIAAAVGDIARGNLTRRLPVRGTAEAATVAIAFNDMSVSLRAARERLLHDAIHDQLTSLPNRVLFIERLERSIRRRYRHPDYMFAVLFVDLDRFKTVNDSLGRPSGDLLLLEVARRLASVVRRDDILSRPHAQSVEQDADNTLARLGGDEFTILLEDMHDPSDAVRVAERLQEVMSKPIVIGDLEVFTSISVGIAVGTTAHRSGEDVVRDADIAMQRAKASGGDRCAIGDASMHDRAVERLQLEFDLRRAVERREFVLHYQPIVGLRGQMVMGFEALLRWQHPTQGLLMPSTFLQVAEETGIIGRIDEWALKEGCSQASGWQRSFPDRPPASVSINVSAQGFGRPDLVALVAHTLEETGLHPRSLRLEITESVAMADAERTRTTLMDLKALGVRISLDDFGTGYSSLSYLQRFPVDTLKIDKSFVSGVTQNDECREIIRTILNLARTLRLDVVAEGTETAQQVSYLEGLDCGYGQGFFFSKGVPSNEVGALLAANLEPLVPV